jgi:hypothetical protein
MTRAEWWNLVHVHQLELKTIVKGFCGKEDASAFTVKVEEHNAPLVHSVLFKAWDKAPDRPGIHALPSWAVLCDLLSEYEP